MSLPTPLPALPLPLPDAVAQPLLRLTEGLDARALWWLSGYAAGLATRAGDAAPAPAPAAPAESAAPRLSIVYGSQTGNAQHVAEGLAAEAEAAGFAVRLLRADAYPLRELARERALLLVLSTQGDGDPSDDARALHDHLLGRRAPRLEQLRYGVLGLGDSSYPQFCAVGQRLDARLAELGGQRLLPRADADLDVDAVAGPWRAQALAAAGEALKPSATVTPLRPPAPARAAATHAQTQPAAAEVLANHALVTAAAGRDVRHLELSLAGAGLHYEPGDALAVLPRNAEAVVDAVLAAARLDGDAAVAHGGATHALRDWLREHRELTRLAKPFLAAHAARGGDAALQAVLSGDHAALSAWMRRRQLVDVLREHRGDWSAADLVAALPPLAPRLYSIASSRKAVDEEAHLTVALQAHGDGDGRRLGAASGFLAAVAEGAQVPVRLEANLRFRLPADPARDVIMIAAGTGIAPFRGFVQERVAVAAGGRHWLFFGNRRFRDDFLYQLEWQRARKDGRLQRIDLAFSRDRAARVYVQDRIREHGRALYDWLQGGAHLYVCGGIAMGKDVHRALREIVGAQRGGADAGDDYLAELQQQGRYARDLY